MYNTYIYVIRVETESHQTLYSHVIIDNIMQRIGKVPTHIF